MRDLLNSYRPASRRPPPPNAGRLREQRARRLRSTSPPEYGRTRSSTALRTTNTPWRRSSDNRTGDRRYFAGVNASAWGRIPQQRSNKNTNIFERGPGGFRWHERYRGSFPEGPEDFGRKQPQPYWKKQRDNGLTSEGDALHSNTYNNPKKPRVEPTRQPEAGTVPLQGVAGWRQTVALAAIDAEINEGVFRGHSMES